MTTVPDLVRIQAARSPEAVAVESAGDRLTYRQLLAEAAALAVHLRRIGVGPGDLAAVAVPRGVDLVPALLGVQFAGAAYLPLEPEHPVDRLNYILSDSGARVLVTPDAAGSRGLRVDTRVHLNDIPVRSDPLPDPPAPGQVAYVIYTSGSTGRPKGVVVAHGAFANLVRFMRECTGVPEPGVWPAVTTVSFDIAGLELFLPLTAGGRVVIARHSEASDPRRLAALLAGAGAQIMQATPITWRLLLEAGWSPPPGFTVLCGGERLPAELAERLLADEVVLWDLYGPTETTVWSSVTRYQRGSQTWFAPVQDTSLYLLDEQLRAVPGGAVGELYIGGAGVAIGYLGRPGLTADRFIADPFARAAGARLYRSGDLARRHPDGRIEILGRSDDQIKIRGFRIEPGEIEHLLATHPSVAEATVRAVDDAAGAARLVGYVRPADPANPPDPTRLKLYLARSAPAYMVPGQLVVMDAFPRTPNGKLDRAALPVPAPPAVPAGEHGDPGQAGVGSADAPAVSVTGQRIAKIVAEVLERPTVGVHEDFFALGGDSLRAVQIVLRLNEELDTEVPINALFETRTVYGLAALLDGDGAPKPRPGAGGGGSGPRLSAAQWRLWLHQRSAPHSTADNMPVVLRLPGPLDLPALESALAGLLERHAILSTRYQPDGSGLPVPVALPPEPVRLVAENGDPRAALAEELARPFDLAAAPPLRIRVVRMDEEHAVLVMVVHRIAADDRSRELIAGQVRAAYRGRAVPDPALGYADVAQWQREFAASPAARRHLDFWRSALAGLSPADLVTDRPRPAIRDWRCGTVRFDLPPRHVRRLHDVAADRDATISAMLLAGFQALLARYTGATDLTVGVPVSGRDRPELEQVVGMLEETAVIRADLRDRPSFAELLVRVHHATLAAVEHAVLPFEDVVAAAAETAGSAPVPGRNPLFDAFFALQRAPADPPGFPLPDTEETRFDLSCRLTERADGGIDGRLEYARQLFDQPAVDQLARGYVQLLGAVGADPTIPAVPVTRAAPAAAAVAAGSTPTTASTTGPDPASKEPAP